MYQVDKGKKRKKILFRGSIITIAAIIVLRILYDTLKFLCAFWAPLILWLPYGNILLLPLSLLFTTATAVLIGYILSFEKVQRLINNLLVRIPIVKLFIKKEGDNNFGSMPGALVELFPGGPCVPAAITGRQRTMFTKEETDLWYKIYVPSAPFPITGNLILSPPQSVKPVNMSLAELIRMITSYGKDSPELLKQVEYSQAS